MVQKANIHGHIMPRYRMSAVQPPFCLDTSVILLHQQTE